MMKKRVDFFVIMLVSVLFCALIVVLNSKKYSDGFRDGWRNAVLDIYSDVGWTHCGIAVGENDKGEQVLHYCDNGHTISVNTVTGEKSRGQIVYDVRHDVVVCDDHESCYAASNLFSGVVKHYSLKEGLKK